jgi:hypothetical protein
MQAANIGQNRGLRDTFARQPGNSRWIMLKSIATIALMLSAGAASAQDWKYKATLYAWVPAMTTTVDSRFGQIEVGQSQSDVLSALDMAFMGTFAAQNDKYGFVADLLYADLSGNSAGTGPLFDSANMVVNLTALSGYALYRLADDPELQFDAGVGFRTFDVSVDTTISGGVLGDQEQSIGNKWTDPLIAARVSMPLDDKWFVTGFADFGGTGAQDQTYQIYAGVGYNFSTAWSGQIGYRNMSLSNTMDGRDVTIDLSGLLMGVSYSF